MTAIKYFCA